MRVVQTLKIPYKNRWNRIAALVPGGKTTAQVKQRYQELLHDISLIKSGGYVDLTEELAATVAEEMAVAYGGRIEHTPPVNSNGRECRWTAEEHKYYFIYLFFHEYCYLKIYNF